MDISVSVIIPTFNRLWCIPKAVESCRNTKCATEIIVVDDGSDDGTWEWLQQQPDIISIRQENQGQTYAVNKGFATACGRYIRFLDSDDFLSEGIIDKQFEKAVATGADLICSRVDIFDYESGAITVNPDINDWADFMEVQLGNGYGSHFLGMLFQRDLVEQVPRRPDFAFREDRMFLLEVALLKPKMAIVEGNAGYWVQHKQQMQGNYSGLKLQAVNWQHLQIYRKILDKLRQRECLTTAYKKAACTVLWPLAHWIAINDIKAANEVVDWIAELDPDFEIPQKGALGFLYRRIGFKSTEKLLRLRRALLLR
ncbi:glycosyltransferase family 2 protein [Mucilaginibacter sp. L3T2-6]|uniref:glycosyltransferase family 2 protein n=1 Tax=Mucilaginibacter sp. L3T2-6 TaxID=3062491 RepID=UPI002674D76B|nr:glycosyltransferase family 2 protein [Mucilaginibacter sp. L3T2-6]MDO3643060.1 glycosyltransferase family 2 protein [Mucilaginibacter sp. L3T2-6]MDV6215827.1 glycosyltransferase family 2 protein [Mucilaginibacter sp. L3T2-6]